MADLLRPTRRGVIGGIGLLFAAPAIVKASSLMPVKPVGLAHLENQFVYFVMTPKVGDVPRLFLQYRDGWAMDASYQFTAHP